MNKCAICGKDCFNYTLCKKCLKELKEKAREETKEEFEKQWNLKEKERSKIFKHADWEVEHNSYYDNLTVEEYKKRVFEIFEKIFFEKLVGCKLEGLVTGNFIHPNEKNYFLYYPERDEDDGI